MKKNLILVINPRSSGFELIREKILPFLDKAHFEKGSFKTFEIQPTSPMENAEELARGLKNGDIILVAGGDGTAHIAANAAAISGRKKLKIKFTGFGNFNDYAHSFSKNSGKAAIEAFETLKVQAEIRPIELKINGKFFRYAPLYATIGLTAEMAEIFEGRRIRKVLKKVHNRNIRLIFSLLAATRFYFKNCRKHILKISEISTDKKEFSKPSLKKGFQEEASVKCMVANATFSRLKYMDFKGDIYDVKYDGKNVNIERETEKDDTLKDYKIEKAYMQGGFSLIEGNETAERINNFNQNMKHIRVYDKDDNEYKSITFKQGINDFVDIKTLDELCDFLKKEVPQGGIVLDKLVKIGFGKRNLWTTFSYDYGDGRSKVIKKDDTLKFEDLFERWE